MTVRIIVGRKKRDIVPKPVSLRDVPGEQVGVYMRVSCAIQTEARTIEGQRSILSGFVGATWPGASPRWYADDGVSGGTMDRPEWQRLLADIGTGEVRAVVVYDLSRAGRSSREVDNWLADMADAGIAVHFVADNMTFDGGALASIWLKIRAVFAEQERIRIRERTSAGLQRKITGGYLHGGARSTPQDRRGCRKLTDEQVREIVGKRRTGARVKNLCREYRLSRAAVYNIIKGISYVHVRDV
jgi:DNA invertase Pin-like site-specific DNA recombinase